MHKQMEKKNCYAIKNMILLTVGFIVTVQLSATGFTHSILQTLSAYYFKC